MKHVAKEMQQQRKNLENQSKNWKEKWISIT